MIRLYKRGEDIPSKSLEIGDIIEVESGIFVKIKEIIKESYESLAGIKKINTNFKGVVIVNEKEKGKYRKPRSKSRENSTL
tara:strand:- start:332 stop:574 length:243 start_codon:yes stop_codon:yes gene_type:complete